MTKTQYKRWKDFALRMARTCFDDDPLPGHPSTEWIVSAVEDFFACDVRQDDIVCYVDWDNSDPYPQGHEFHGEDLYGHANSPYPMCDTMSEWECDVLWYHYDKLMSDDDAHWHDIHEEVGDWGFWGFSNPIREEVVERFGDPVRCCVRAGLDFASAPSAGVLGFTAGDLRRMYPEGVPDWVAGDDKWCPWLREHNESECSYFEELPDERGVVL